MKRFVSTVLALAMALAMLMCGTACAEEWTCPDCGQAGNTGNFCPTCGAQRPETDWTCPACGQTGNTGNFCPTCGMQRGAEAQEVQQPQQPQQTYTNPNLEQIPGETEKVKVRLVSVDASEFIEPGDNPSKWQPSNAADSNETTCWQYTARDGAWLELNIGMAEAVDELWVKNGFWGYNDKGVDQYSINARPKNITVKFLYNGENKYRDDLKATLLDEWGSDWQRIDLGHHEDVTSVRIVIHSSYKGSYYKNDVCLSEVMLVQHGSAANAMPAQAEGKPVIYESRPEVTGCALLDKIATRSGPSPYDYEPGTFFGKNNAWKSQTVRVLKKSVCEGTWWVQIDFQNGKGGKRYRVWTGAKRVDVDLDKVKTEVPIGDCDIYPTKDTHWGPGKNYADAKISIKEDATGQLYAIDNGYADVEYFCDDGTYGRVWVPREAVHNIDTSKDRSGEN